MNDKPSKGLLPPGMNDILPPDAAFETATVERLLSVFRGAGYEQVKPPLLEFEDSLLGGAGAAMTQQTFRLMDPASHAMLGLRADMTLQVARIATTRLDHEPRPLRLCYAGQVLQVSGSQMRPERQVGQAGIELIGSDLPRADAEAIILAYEALACLGVSKVSIDLNLPTLVTAVIEDLGLDDDVAALARAALARKDAGAIAALGAGVSDVLGSLLKAAGPADSALAALGKLKLPKSAMAACDRLGEVVALVRKDIPEIRLTIDPVENRGFEYHTGVAFVLFGIGVRGELGRGGRYLAGGGSNGTTFGVGISGNGGEPATGFTLFMDTVLRAVPPMDQPRRVYVPVDETAELRRALQGDGWIVVVGLEAVKDTGAEGLRLGCSHELIDGKPEVIKD
ncbi:MAG: ATP phosphoribosyltransferase regulatory subunit [Rhodospirillales bacterium]|jgi:ATP phosphoribosyltransferase regulatory subunit|nr:ATP phosphoribosyltransferase regulatory subunit [Rhodospirillales bacterium]MBT4006803.1 ATP phosphoribosyltransferase regulatory subunit [Rhodospirillales bacterium]MBT5077133.1 ATP phosphoribosyltransferase regulatory subunit [Rhodospirillales bacterium]MBT5113714.1 ATP phosphoribosyltransferase regulatory subunit [Rhodospirillales bacterium]MBT5673973.1 ATP phosphoribosyltransferase regulatory subunit [Rhodospirillales bacterium]